MKNIYRENFDGITAGDQAKQAAVEKLMQYNSAVEDGLVTDIETKKIIIPKRRGLFKSKLRISVAVTAAIMLIFCSAVFPIIWSRRVSSAMLKNCVFNLSGAKGLGIVQSSSRPQYKANLFSGAQIAYAEDKEQDWMVVYDDNGNIKDVIFFRYKENGETEEVTQLKMSAPIQRLHVTEKFTFIMFSFLIEPGVTEDYKRQAYYHTRGYTCDPSHSQSFVIDNSTGKVHSLEPLFKKYNQTVFMDVFEECVMIEYAHGPYVERHFYIIDVEDGGLAYTRLTGDTRNNNISNNIYLITDKLGQVFVASDVLDETTDNVRHFVFDTDNFSTNPFIGEIYGKGSDGYAYKITATGTAEYTGKTNGARKHGYEFHNMEFTIKKIGENFEETEVADDINVSITLGSEQYSEIGSSHDIILKDSKLFYVFQNGTCIVEADLSDGVYKQSGVPDSPSNRLSIYESDVYYVQYDEQSAGFLHKGTLYHYDISSGRKTAVLDGVAQILLTRSGLLAYNGAVQGRDAVPAQYYSTKIYKVTNSNGQITAEILFEIPEELNLITLQSLI